MADVLEADFYDRPGTDFKVLTFSESGGEEAVRGIVVVKGEILAAFDPTGSGLSEEDLGEMLSDLMARAQDD